MSGVIFDVKHFAVHDGPGIRTTIFLKGCPLRCQWCHSPESQSPRPEIAYQPDLCIGCGACVEACPNQAQTMGRPKILRERCTGTGSCAEECYSGALTLYGVRVSVEGLMEEVERNRLIIETSGGGVTLSGGEPTVQPRFASGLLRALKERGYHTTLDTCGHVEWETLLRVLANVDLVLYDLKHMDPVQHEKMTGAPNWLILSNLKKAAGLQGKSLVVRVPVIPGLNDSQSNFMVLGRFLGSIHGIDSIELLPYHNLGAPKYEALGRDYALAYLQPPSAERLRMLAGLLEARGLNVVLEGLE
ncbi:MAG: glycyl-radical enzyme activating protein [Candidatus Bathyarchaeota archaeon]|nr:MAG: glycyl-radical enzyme activating protein [Candidatus Bathyarchaeota archaeon]